MEEPAIGLIIRTAFNNNGWAGCCKNPYKDTRCFKCIKGGLFINGGKPIYEDGNGYCKGDYIDYPLAGTTDIWCWEQDLCKKFVWGNVKGKWREVYKGMPVYFVYTELDGSYTIWGHSKIDRIDNSPDKYPPIYFKPFKPLPQNKWVKDLSAKDMIGKDWRQLHYRYLDKSHANYLSALVSGDVSREDIKKPSNSLEHYESMSIELRADIKNKIEKIASMEGREVKELVREAIAKLINERKS